MFRTLVGWVIFGNYTTQLYGDDNKVLSAAHYVFMFSPKWGRFLEEPIVERQVETTNQDSKELVVDP